MHPRLCRAALLTAAMGVVLMGAACKKEQDNAADTPPQATAHTQTATTQNGAAIDPLCFLQAWENEAEAEGGVLVKLQDCGTLAQARAINSPYYTVADGFTGTAWIPAEDEETETPRGMSQAFIEYRIVGALPASNRQDANQQAVLVRESGGGSGLFSSLYVIENIDAQTIRIARNIAAGDRCNGGIVDARVENGALQYDVSLTPFTLYAAGEGGVEDVYTVDLPDCAVCCTATAHYRDADLTGVSLLGQDDQYGTGSVDEDSDQVWGCYNRLAAATAQQNATLDITALRAFTQRIHSECLPAVENEPAAE